MAIKTEIEKQPIENENVEQTQGFETPVRYDKGKGLSELSTKNYWNLPSRPGTMDLYAKRTQPEHKRPIDINDLVNQYNGEEGYYKIDDSNKPQFKEWLLANGAKEEAFNDYVDPNSAPVEKEPEPEPKPNKIDLYQEIQAALERLESQGTDTNKTVHKNNEDINANTEKVLEKVDEGMSVTAAIADVMGIPTAKVVRDNKRNKAIDAYKTSDEYTKSDKQEELLKSFTEKWDEDNPEADNPKIADQRAKYEYLSEISKEADLKAEKAKSRIEELQNLADTEERELTEDEEREIYELDKQIKEADEYKEYMNNAFSEAQSSYRDYADKMYDLYDGRIDQSYIKELPKGLIRAYKDGEFGDPDSKDAKRHLAYFIGNSLQTMFSNIGQSFQVANGKNPDYQKDAWSQIAAQRLDSAMKSRSDARNNRLQTFVNTYGDMIKDKEGFIRAGQEIMNDRISRRYLDSLDEKKQVRAIDVFMQVRRAMPDLSMNDIMKLIQYQAATGGSISKDSLITLAGSAIAPMILDGVKSAVKNADQNLIDNISAGNNFQNASLIPNLFGNKSEKPQFPGSDILGKPIDENVQEGRESLKYTNNWNNTLNKAIQTGNIDEITETYNEVIKNNSDPNTQKLASEIYKKAITNITNTSNAKLKKARKGKLSYDDINSLIETYTQLGNHEAEIMELETIRDLGNHKM